MLAITQSVWGVREEVLQYCNYFIFIPEDDSIRNMKGDIIISLKFGLFKRIKALVFRDLYVRRENLSKETEDAIFKVIGEG